MQDTQTLKAKIITTLDTLPESSLQTLAEFVAFLREKAEQPPDTVERIIKLGGLWAGTPEITDEDIAAARREMWGNLGEREL